MRINDTLEALSEVKDLTLEELTALLEAFDEKAKSTQDLSATEKEFADGLIVNVITDFKYLSREREAEAARQAENEILDRKFGFVRGDATHD
jgi:hypothetical protein